MKLANNFIAVGVANEEDCVPCVVIYTGYGMTIKMPEHDTRKLADDILRNANYLWPVETEGKA